MSSATGQEDVFSANYLGKETRKGALVSKLNELHKVLKGLSQDPADRPEGLKRTAAQLISTKILGNPDKDLRLLASCCIVDVFRLFAPDAPYSDEEMVAVFDVIIAQLRGLSMHDPGAGTGNKIMYILNSLATVKTCVVPVILAQSGIAGAEDLVKALFEALISSVRPEHGEDGKKIHTICATPNHPLYPFTPLPPPPTLPLTASPPSHPPSHLDHERRASVLHRRVGGG